MDLKELKKLADALDDSGKRELIYFLQSRTKRMATPIRAIDEIQYPSPTHTKTSSLGSVH